MSVLSYAEYSNLSFSNDFVFCCVLMDNPELCMKITELATGRRIKEIISIQSQKSIKESFDGKGVRFDVVFEDDEGTIYDVEMQKTGRKNLPKRTRYYQSMIDLASLRKGGDYKSIKNSYIIFVCDFDPFKIGHHKYLVKNSVMCAEEAEFDDGAYKVFLNAHYSDKVEDSELRKFLDYVRYGIIQNELTGQIDAAVIKVLNDDERRAEFMFLSEKYDICREEGRAIAKLEDVSKLVNAGKCDAREACEILEVPFEDYEKYLEENDLN